MLGQTKQERDCDERGSFKRLVLTACLINTPRQEMTLWCRLGLKPSILGSSPSIAQTFCCVHPFHLKCALNENVTIFDNELASHMKLDRIRPGGACTILRICNNKMQVGLKCSKFANDCIAQPYGARPVCAYLSHDGKRKQGLGWDSV